MLQIVQPQTSAHTDMYISPRPMLYACREVRELEDMQFLILEALRNTLERSQQVMVRMDQAQYTFQLKSLLEMRNVYSTGKSRGCLTTRIQKPNASKKHSVLYLLYHFISLFFKEKSGGTHIVITGCVVIICKQNL